MEWFHCMLVKLQIMEAEAVPIMDRHAITLEAGAVQALKSVGNSWKSTLSDMIMGRA